MLCVKNGVEKHKVSIVILTWNGLDYTKKCLTSLKESALKAGAEVWVVDNGSSDGTVEYLRGIDWIKLVENGKNLGFVRGNNVALRQITDGDVVLLNNDIIISQPDWLEKMQQTAYNDEKTGIVGCRLINEKGELLCKVINNDSSVNVEEQVKMLNLLEDGPEIIFLYNTKFHDYDMPTLYRSADCFVTATRGEGWGMPILEAMAC